MCLCANRYRITSCLAGIFVDLANSTLQVGRWPLASERALGDGSSQSWMCSRRNEEASGEKQKLTVVCMLTGTVRWTTKATETNKQQKVLK